MSMDVQLKAIGTFVVINSFFLFFFWKFLLMVFLLECFLTNFLSLLNICYIYFLYQWTICNWRWVETDVARGWIEWSNRGGRTGNTVIVLAFIECIVFVIFFCFDSIMTMHCTRWMITVKCYPARSAHVMRHIFCVIT